MREEIEFHIAMRADHDGIDETSARRRFGNVLRAQEEMRRVWIAAFWDILLQDALYTWRSWRRNRTFAVAAVFVLALGLGTSTALFSALDRILFRNLPYPKADRLASVGLVFLPGPAGVPQPETMIDRAYFGSWKPAPAPFESITNTLSQELAMLLMNGQND
jgi:putative ABC transport system permease protein